MKKTLIVFLTFTVVLIMVSSSTAVPQTQSTVTMKVINRLNSKSDHPLIDFIIAVFWLVVTIIKSLFSLSELFGQISRLLNLIFAIRSTLDLIAYLIDVVIGDDGFLHWLGQVLMAIQDNLKKIFNPDETIV